MLPAPNGVRPLDGLGWAACCNRSLQCPSSAQAFPNGRLSCCRGWDHGLSSLLMAPLALPWGRGQHVALQLQFPFICKKQSPQRAHVRPCCIIQSENVLCFEINFRSILFRILYFLSKCCHGCRH